MGLSKNGQFGNITLVHVTYMVFYLQMSPLFLGRADERNLM